MYNRQLIIIIIIMIIIIIIIIIIKKICKGENVVQLIRSIATRCDSSLVPELLLKSSDDTPTGD